MSSAANPRAQGQPGKQDTDTHVPQEPTGPIASDSLAAESLKNQGGFAANTDATPLGVRGASSTLANEDTSGATVLPPASSGAEREIQELRGLGSDERGTKGGVKYPEGDPPPTFTGTHGMEQGYAGGPSADRETTGYQTSGGSTSTSTNVPANESQREADVTTAEGEQSSSTTGTQTTSGADAGAGAAGVRPYVDQAPTYAGVTSGAIRSEGELKPKGTNLHEGDVPQTKTFIGDVGGQHDPARLAEQKMLRQIGGTAGEGVGGIRQDVDADAGDGAGPAKNQGEPVGTGGGGQYEALDVERAGKQGLDE